MKKWLNYLPGLILTITIGILAKQLSQLIDNVGSVTLAIILGLIVGNLVKPGKIFSEGIRLSEKKILSLAIMLMGLQLNLQILSTLGFQTIIYILILISLSIMIGLFLGQTLGLSRPFSLLIGVGNGICGSSAIAAAAPLLDASEEETGLSISVVNLLGTIGIFLAPLIVQVLLNFNSANSGVFIGGTLQAVGQVTAAGFSLNEEVGNIATVVKMGRILMLGPVLLILGLFNGKNGNSQGISSGFPIPNFIIGFFIFSLIASLNILPADWLSFLKSLSKEALIIAMAGIGLKIRFASLLRQGPKALLVGSLNFGIQIIAASLLILFLY